MHFASDNTSGVAPQIMAAMSAANEGHVPSYGADAVTEAAVARIRALFEAPEAAVYFVATGTAANALSCAILTKPWETIFCHREAHIEVDECGAPEFYTNGAKLTLVEGDHGRMTPEALHHVISVTGPGAVHHIQRGMVSITNTTEAGTLYTPEDVGALAVVAQEFGLPLHMDGSRFANAVAALGVTPADLSWRAGVDVLSFGGTKNGCMGVEAVIIFDPKRAWEFELRRKRAGHLFSKSRFLSAQMLGYLGGGLWLDLARHANQMAARLSEGILAVPGTSLLHPTEANAVFAVLPRITHAKLRNAGADYYFWPDDPAPEGPADEPIAARFVCSWATTEAEVDAFLNLLG